MNIQLLKDILGSLDDTLQAANSRNASTEIRKLELLFPEADETSAIAAITEIERQLSNEKVEIRDSYADRLNVAGTSKDRFSRVLADLTADRLMGQEDLGVIATAYIGASKRWKSRCAVLQSIEEKFNERAYLESKMRLLG